MLKKKTNKPLYFKKSKASKYIEEEEVSESEESFTESQSEYQSPRRRRRERFNRGYEYYTDVDDRNYEDQYRYYDNNSMYDMDSKAYSYTSQATSYNKPSVWGDPYYTTEIGQSDESVAGYKMYPKSHDRKHRHRGPRMGRNTEFSEYTSDYSHIEEQPRKKGGNKYFSKKRKGRPSQTSENETNAYRSDINVYLAHEHVGHRGFRHKKSKDYMTESETENRKNRSSYSEESASDSPLREKQRKPQFQVYAAEVAPTLPKGGFDEQVPKKSQERIMSVTNYDGNANLPMMALRDKTANAVARTESGILYLPVLVLDNAIKLSKNKIIPPEILIEKNDEKAEKPLETNIQVYAATDMDGKNIFQQAKKSDNDENFESALNQNITIYTVGKESINPIALDYPVQKSYINVAPSNIKSGKTTDKRKSKLRNTLSASSIRSLISKVTPKALRKKKKIKKEKTETENEGATEFEAVELIVSNPDTEREKKENTFTKRSSSAFNIPEEESTHYSIYDRRSKFDTSAMNSQKKPHIIEGKNFRKSESDPTSSKQKKHSLVSGPKDSESKTSVAPETKGSETRKSVLSDIKNIETKKSFVAEPKGAEPRKSFITDTKGTERRKSFVTDTKGTERRKSFVTDLKRTDTKGNEMTTGFELKKYLESDTQGNEVNNEIKGTMRGSTVALNPRHNSTTETRKSGVGERSLLGERSVVIGLTPEDKRKISVIESHLEKANDMTKKHNTAFSRKSEPTIQPLKEEVTKPASEPIHRTDSKVMQSEKKKKGHPQERTTKTYIHTIQPPNRPVLAAIPETQDIPSIRKDSNSNTSSHNTQSMSGMGHIPHRKKHPHSQSPLQKRNILEHQHSTQSDEITAKPHYDKRNSIENALTLWGFNASGLVYVFQAAQFLMGVCLHDKLMEVLNIFLYNEET